MIPNCAQMNINSLSRLGCSARRRIRTTDIVILINLDRNIKYSWCYDIDVIHRVNDFSSDRDNLYLHTLL